MVLSMVIRQERVSRGGLGVLVAGESGHEGHTRRALSEDGSFPGDLPDAHPPFPACLTPTLSAPPCPAHPISQPLGHDTHPKFPHTNTKIKTPTPAPLLTPAAHGAPLHNQLCDIYRIQDAIMVIC
jgi:hypothetical protein